MFLKNPVTHVATRCVAVSAENDLLRQCQGIARTAAEPWNPGEGVEAGIRRSARRLGLSYRRARTLWYAQPCRLLFAEVQRLRQWHDEWLTRRVGRLADELAILQAIEAELRGEPEA